MTGVETYGPNSAAVEALIRRAQALTATEADAFFAARVAAQDAAWQAARHTARHTARYAAWDAVWYAAQDAAQDAVLDAARYAARNAAWVAARYAARDAAAALVVRDLVTHDHYTILTSQWASVIGPAHPDDEVTACESQIM